ncbi:MAG: GNAT family N-acetyltransferase [Acidimicrobiales bacterium]
MTNTAARPGAAQLRTTAWRGRADVALVVPVPEGPPPDERAVRACCDRLAAQGVTHVLTGALNPDEQHGFLAAGFVEHERLHLLIHDLWALPDVRTSARLRRARRTDRAEVVAIDRRAFQDFWQLDEAGLLDAVAATPTARFRVGTVGSDLAGYAICGRAGTRGFVQRLAVDPAHRGIGLGAAMVADGLWWLRRHGAQEAMVNTQVGNDRALHLYGSLGFRLQPVGLTVLTRSLERRSQRADKWPSS